MLVVTLTLVITMAMAYLFYSSRGMAERYAPLVNAAKEIKLAATGAHLWFEEIIAGDPYIEIERVWALLQQAEWYTLALLNRGEDHKSKYDPPADPLLRAQVEETLERLKAFSAIASERWQTRSDAGIGSESEQRFDQLFELLLRSIDQIEDLLLHSMEAQLRQLYIVQLLLIGVVATLGLFVAALLQRQLQRRQEDLAQLRNRERLLDASDMRFRTLFEKSNDAIFLVDRESGRYQDANQAASRLTGRSIDELKQLCTRDLLQESAQADERLDLIMQTDHARSMGEVIYLQPDNTERLAYLSVIPLDQKHVISIARDITEERETERQLRRSQKMDAIGQLTGGIAHDFNNILGIILGNIDLLERYSEVATHGAKQIDTIRRSALRAANLTRQMLGFARQQAAQVSVTDINQAIQEMESLVTRSVTPLVEVEQRLQKGLWLTEIDVNDFKDTLLNLVLNARDAMPAGGKLTITTSNVRPGRGELGQIAGAPSGEYILLSVADSGSGMAPDLQERIFEPFFTTKELGKGTGLGLSMVFGFVNRSGGDINVASEMGGGTEIKLYLPRSTQQQLVPVAEATQPQELPRGEETILVVDDEPALLNVTRGMLEALGYQVLTSSDCQQALTLLAQENAIDLLFSDIVMPGGMNGYQLAAAATAQRPELKVLLTSGYTEHRPVDQNPNRTHNKLLPKPYSRMELAYGIRNALAGAIQR